MFMSDSALLENPRLGCLRSCKFSPICFERERSRFLLVHGERLLQGSDIWTMPRPWLRHCGTFESTSDLSYNINDFNISVISAASLERRKAHDEVTWVDGETVGYHVIGNGAHHFHDPIHYASAVYKAMQLAGENYAEPSQSSARLFIINRPGVESVFDMQLLASHPIIYADSLTTELTCFRSLTVGITTHQIFSISVPTNAGARRNPDFNFLSDWTDVDVAQFKIDYLFSLGLHPPTTALIRPAVGIIQRGRLRRRWITNLDEVLVRINSDLGDGTARGVFFHEMDSFHRQVAEVLFKIDVFVGVHGGFMGFAFFLSPGSVVIEIDFMMRSDTHRALLTLPGLQLHYLKFTADSIQEACIRDAECTAPRNQIASAFHPDFASFGGQYSQYQMYG